MTDYLLQPLGLSRCTNDVYLALLRARDASARTVAGLVGLDERSAVAELDRLVALGLVNQLGHGEAPYAAVPPDTAVPILIQQRRAELTSLQSSVDALSFELPGSASGSGEQTFTHVEGEQAILSAAAELQTARDEVLVIASPPFLGGRPSLNNRELEALANGVSWRVIYHPDSLCDAEQVAAVRRLQQAGEQARILPDPGIKMGIADRKLALVIASTTRPDPTRRFLIRESSVLDLLVEHFERLWAQATPFESSGACCSSADDAMLTDKDRQLLTLLASGMKDRTIARTMGVTERTVGRRVTDLMHKLDADTRFKAGAQASVRGWI